MRTLADAQSRHAAAVEAYAARAKAIAHNNWMRAPAERKWSPAAITTHLSLSLEAFAKDLRGEGAMQMRVKGFKLALIRFMVMRRILRDGHFPSGAPAPRETRPPAELAPQAESLKRFTEAAARLETTIANVKDHRPGARLTHPYFGQVGLTDALFISARHIEHHMKQL